MKRSQDLMSKENCPLCLLPTGLRAQIEAEYIRGTLSVNDIAIRMKEDGADVDLLEIMVHLSDHDSTIEEEVERKKKFRGEKMESEYIPEPLPMVTSAEDVDSLEFLYRIFELLEVKLGQIAQSKSASGISAITKELRETLREIERVKKERKGSLADRTAALLDEHDEMNRFLAHSLCNICMEKYLSFLRGEFEIKAVGAHGENGTNNTADAIDSGTVE